MAGLLSIEPSNAQSVIQLPLGAGGPLLDATFLSRPNRFLVNAELNGIIVQAHLADRGRLLETLIPGVRLLLARHAGAHRKTAFQAVAAIREARATTLISLDTHLPNRLIEAALRAEALLPFRGYTALRREVTVGGSRFDFQLTDDVRRCTVEVKSAGPTVGGIALFPDAPTERGRRHVTELAALARAGERVAVVFVAQGGDAQAVKWIRRSIRTLQLRYRTPQPLASRCMRTPARSRRLAFGWVNQFQSWSLADDFLLRHAGV